MSDTHKNPKLTAIVKIYEAGSPVEGHAIRCRIHATGLVETEGGSDVWHKASTGIQQAVGHLALAIRLNNEGADQAHLRDAIREAGVLPNIGKLDASKITIKDEAEEAPALFTISKRDGSKVKITQTGVEVVIGDHDGTLMQHAMAALPLILERERDRQLYQPHPPISLLDAAATIRMAIEEGTDAEVDLAGDIIAELVRFIGRADDDDTELAEAIAHERKRAQAEDDERTATFTSDHDHTATAASVRGEAHTTLADLAISLIEQDGLTGAAGWDSLYSEACDVQAAAATLTDAQSAIKAGPSCSAQDAVSGIAEGLAAAGPLGTRPFPAPTPEQVHRIIGSGKISCKDVRWGLDLASGPDKTLWTCAGINADTMIKAHNEAMRTGKALVRLTRTHAEGLQVELVEGVAEVPPPGPPVTDDHRWTTKENRSIDPLTGRVTHTTTITESYGLTR